MSSKPLVSVVACALTDDDGRVLLARRPAHKPMPGLWEFPGGKMELGETPEVAIIREMQEELGISIRDKCLAPLTFVSYAYDDFHLLLLLFVCRKWEGDITPVEGQELKWIRPLRLRDLQIIPADEPFIPVLQEWL
ncbi:MAG: (deoxy)nucleoside triphosphate pyrophosphohydrolase [Alphaproteobacteria bacterium]